MRKKITALLLTMVLFAMLLVAAVSLFTLRTLKEISNESSHLLGQTAADEAKTALEKLAREHIQDIAEEKAAFIEEKFQVIEGYVHGMVALAEKIYSDPDAYPDREVALPVPGSQMLAAQLLAAEDLNILDGKSTKEVLKLGNMQDLLIEYCEQNSMVSSIYIATETGWMIQADYIAKYKYQEGMEYPAPYEAAGRPWYILGRTAAPGKVVYTEIFQDIYTGKNNIVCAAPVYCNDKLVAVVGIDLYLETLEQMISQTRIGETGYALLVDEDEQIIASPQKEGKMAMGESAATDDTGLYFASAPLSSLGWHVITVMDAKEVLVPANEGMEKILEKAEEVEKRQDAAIDGLGTIFFVIYVGITLFVCLIAAKFSRKLADPIHKLTKAVAELNGGNLDKQVQLHTKDELEELAHAFNKMARQIKQDMIDIAESAQKAERARMEISVAARLQIDMLPKAEEIMGVKKEIILDTYIKPAKGVGGDFYDFFLVDEDHLALVMADVSGKGIPAALFMAMAKTTIRSLITRKQPLDQTAKKINDSLCANNKNDMFVTAWLGVLTLSTGHLTYVNAGHCSPLLLRKDGSAAYETFRSGFVLAGMEDTVYRSNEMVLKQGDTLLLYTDGVTEATNSKKELYGEERLYKSAAGLGFLPTDLLETVREDVEDFQKEEEQFDDITMLALTYRGITDQPD